MPDPHVVALYYRLETGRQLAFNEPTPLEKVADAFSLRLANGQLRVEMKDHFATADAARLKVDPYMRSWEIATDLKHGPGAIRFRFESPEIIDRDPPPPGASVVVQLEGVSCVATAGVVAVVVTSKQYPDPPDRFVASPDVETMWLRYSGYVAGKEPLLSMAYMCLTVLEASTGKAKRKREAAAKRYTVDIDVLKKLGALTTERGDAATARKVEAGRPFQPLSDTETTWVKDVIRALIRRVGEWRADSQFPWPKITMADFPKL